MGICPLGGEGGGVWLNECLVFEPKVTSQIFTSHPL